MIHRVGLAGLTNYQVWQRLVSLYYDAPVTGRGLMGETALACYDGFVATLYLSNLFFALHYFFRGAPTSGWKMLKEANKYGGRVIDDRSAKR